MTLVGTASFAALAMFSIFRYSVALLSTAENRVAVINETIVLPCLDKSSNGTNRWRYKNSSTRYVINTIAEGQEKVVFPWHSINSTNPGQYDLNINGVKLTDAGFYTCWIANKSESMYVVVLERPPQCIAENIYIQEQAMINISCYVNFYNGIENLQSMITLLANDVNVGVIYLNVSSGKGSFHYTGIGRNTTITSNLTTCILTFYGLVVIEKNVAQNRPEFNFKCKVSEVTGTPFNAYSAKHINNNIEPATENRSNDDPRMCICETEVQHLRLLVVFACIICILLLFVLLFCIIILINIRNVIGLQSKSRSVSGQVMLHDKSEQLEASDTEDSPPRLREKRK